MAAKTASAGLSKEERDAVKQRAAELRAQEKAGKSRVAGEQAIADVIAGLSGSDKEIAQGFVDIAAEVAPELMPKTYYGFPAFANDAGKTVVFLKPAGKFNDRYATLGFEDAATLDDGDIWPVAYAILALTPHTKAIIRAAVERAAG